MMAGWAVYTLITTALMIVVGTAAERLARALAAPTRVVWLGVILVSVTLSITSLAHWATLMAPLATPRSIAGAPARHLPTRTAVADTKITHRPATSGASATLGPGTGIRRLLEGAVVRLDLRWWQRFDPALAMISRALAGLALLIIAAAMIRLHQLAKSFEAGEVDGVAVLVSHDVGPAVLGVLRPRIVIPNWVITLPADERRVVLLHEQEHVAARDQLLVVLGMLALAMQPWNLPLWVAVSRLRFALEADCDARVLRRGIQSVQHYGSLLLQVCERRLSPRISISLPASALVDSTSNLERRVRRMTGHQPRFRSISTTAALVAAVVGIGAAFTVRVSNARAVSDARAVTSTAAGAAAVLIRAMSPPESEPGIDGASLAPRWPDSLPQIVNTQHGPTSPALRLVSSSTSPGAPRGAFAPETLFVGPGAATSSWRARIITRSYGVTARVAVTDTIGRLLPFADTLVVDGPVRLILPDVRFDLIAESLEGDLSITTSARADRNGEHWVATLSGRSVSVSRTGTGESAQFIAAKGSIVKEQRAP